MIAVEDLQWIDRTSEAVLKYLLESIPGARVLLIFTYRTEFVPTWGARTYHNQILLNRLSNRESLLMVNHLLGTDDVESALEKVILEKTEGIPFFVEEFIKSLKDLGFIERKDSTYRIAKALQSIRIPSTIQDIIMARVDALPEGAKELLQVGSLIEREFGYKLIKAAMHLPEEELLRRLSFLKDAELLYERGLFPDSTFVFKHALTREVVHGSLLERKKKQLHIDIGQAIEEVYKDNLEERYSTIAEHFQEGGDYEKVATYFHLSQRRARRASAHIDAITFSRKEVFCLEKLPQAVEVQKRVIDARVTLANNCFMCGNSAEARDAVAPVVDLVHKLDYRKRMPAIYVIVAGYLLTVEERYNEDETLRYLREARRLALEEKDYLSLWLTYFYEGTAHGFNCEFAEGESCLLRIMEMSEAAGDVPAIVSTKGVISALFYATGGKIEEAITWSQEALQLALQADDLYLKGLAYQCHGVALLRKGLFPEAEETFTLAVEMTQKTDAVGFLMDSFLFLGLLHSEMGRYREAQECFDGVLAMHERVRIFPSVARLAQIMKVAAELLGHLDPVIDNVLNFDINEIRMLFFQGMAAHAIGEIFLNIDNAHMDEAEAWIRKAIETNEQNRMPWDLAKDYALYAEFFKKKGDPARARENLLTAIGIFGECGADGWVERYEKELPQ